MGAAQRITAVVKLASICHTPLAADWLTEAYVEAIASVINCMPALAVASNAYLPVPYSTCFQASKSSALLHVGSDMEHYRWTSASRCFSSSRSVLAIQTGVAALLTVFCECGRG